MTSPLVNRHRAYTYIHIGVSIYIDIMHVCTLAHTHAHANTRLLLWVHYRLCLQSANTHLAAARSRLGRRRPIIRAFCPFPTHFHKRNTYLEIVIVSCVQKFVCCNVTRDLSNTIILFIIKVYGFVRNIFYEIPVHTWLWHRT